MGRDIIRKAVGRDMIRKAVAGMLAFIIGISIVMVVLAPLLIYLNTLSGETLRAMDIVREFQSQGSRESVDLVLVRGDSWIKNAGSIPLTIILAVIDSGGGCKRGPLLLKTNITLDPGDMVKNISGYGPEKVCYVVTSRGNVFPVKEKLIPQETLLTPVELKLALAENLSSFNITARYSTDNIKCDRQGIPALRSFVNYDPGKRLLTINNLTTQNTVLYDGKKGCFSLAFRNAVDVTEDSYAVAVFYKIVLVFDEKSGNKLGTTSTLCLGQRCNSLGEVLWSPRYLTTDYVVLEGITLISMGGAAPGMYDLNITLTFDVEKGTKFYVGVEYIAVLGARLVTG